MKVICPAEPNESRGVALGSIEAYAWQSSAPPQVEVERILAAVATTKKTMVRCATGEDYEFHRFPFGERGELLEHPLVNEIGTALKLSTRALFSPFETIVSPEPGGHPWGLLLAFLLNKTTFVLRTAGKLHKAQTRPDPVRSYPRFDSAFELDGPVLVVDDVVSSGQTLDEIFGLLELHSIPSVGALAIVDKGTGRAEVSRRHGIPVEALVSRCWEAKP